jgi:hypothetical protein
MLKFHMGKDFDIATLLMLMRFLRAAKEDSKQINN